MPAIATIIGSEIIDSRGNPTVEPSPHPGRTGWPNTTNGFGSKRNWARRRFMRLRFDGVLKNRLEV